ncbi:hypothetical protein RMATCC62417_08843 [Rhizopus microsporus]|nr:hypothetical protein RMATCC62417_08843 [Rhizopus microsporus]
MSSLINRAIEAIDEAATETVIFNAEKQVEILQKARKRKRITKTPKVLVNEDEVDDYDKIDAIGHSTSLMFLVRSFGVKLYKKGWKNLNAVERFMAELCLNSIVDLHDNQLMKAVGLDVQAIQDLQTKFMISNLTCPNVDKEVQQLMKKADKLSSLREKYNLHITTSLTFGGDIRKKIEILAAVYKNFVFKKNDVKSWKTMSEWSIIIKLWVNIFEILFEEEDGISLVWGDTKNDQFKVDLRICLMLYSDKYDITNIEFKKNGGDIRATKEDAAKVLVEGKTILNSLSQYHNLNLQETKNIKVVVGQFCGLKGEFKQIRLVAPGAYMVDKWGGTIKYPINERMVDAFVDKLEQLFVFKDDILKKAESLKGRLLEDDSPFGSQSTTEDQSFLKKTYYLSRKTKNFPKLNDDLFKVSPLV